MICLEIDADLSNVLAASHVIKSLNYRIATKVKSLLHWKRQVMSADEANCVFKHLLGADHDAVDISTLPNASPTTTGISSCGATAKNPMTAIIPPYAMALRDCWIVPEPPVIFWILLA